jgi:hypothetical protein
MSALEDEAFGSHGVLHGIKRGLIRNKITTCGDEKLFPHMAIAMI